MSYFDFSIVCRVWSDFEIRQRADDGYINLTDMVKIYPQKRLNNWLRSNSTKEYLQALGHDTGIPVTRNSATGLIQINQGGVPELQGTWGHRLVALHFAQWLNPVFAIQVNQWVEEIVIRGYVVRSDAAEAQLREAEIKIELLKELLHEQQEIRKSSKHGVVDLVDEIADNLDGDDDPLQAQVTATVWLNDNYPNYCSTFKSRFHRAIADLYRLTYKKEPEKLVINIGGVRMAKNTNAYMIPRDTPLVRQALETVKETMK